MTGLNQLKTSEIYNRKARIYEQKWEKYLTHTHQKMLEAFESKQNHRILDVSAGTGLFAHHLIEKGVPFSQLVLNDVSAGMLNIARERFTENSRVSFTAHFAESLGFESLSFDTVISLNAFHNYVDQRQALSEIYRVLKPGGRLLVLDWNRKGLFQLVNFCIRTFTGEFIQTVSAEEVKQLLESKDFSVQELKEWKFRYWNFFLCEAEK